MTRRPMCLACLFLIISMYFAELLGFPIISGNPFSEELQNLIESQNTSSVCGMVDHCDQTEYGQTVYLKNAYLIFNSNTLSIQNIKVNIDLGERIISGGFCLFEGKLERIPKPRNPGEFDSRQYYACRHIYYQMKNAVVKRMNTSGNSWYAFREHALVFLKKIFVDVAGEDAPFFHAVVLGERSGLDEKIKIRFQMSGIMHLLSISGMHLGIIVMGIYSVLMRIGFGMWPSCVLSMGSMLLYGFLTGGSSAILRAMCMFTLMMIARLSGKIYDMMTGLSVAAMILLIETPSYLYDCGFLFSFSAVLGIGIVSPAMSRFWLKKRKKAHTVGWKRMAISGMSIQLVMLPVQLWAYGEVSLVGMFLNLIVLPTVGVLIGSGFLAMPIGVIWKAGGRFVIFPGRLLFHLYEWLSDLAGRNPYETWIAGCPKTWQIILYYVFLIIICRYMEIWGERKSRDKDRKIPLNRKGLVLALLASALFLLMVREHRMLRIACLDVGQGDCIVVETPQREYFLLDGGSSNKKNIGQYQLIPYLRNRGISRLDAIIVSHADEDHISGIQELFDRIEQNLVNIKVQKLVLPQLSEPGENYERLRERAMQIGIRVYTVKQGDVLSGKMIQWSILSPDAKAVGKNSNEEAIVLDMRYLGFRGLFMGDVGIETEEKLLNKWEKTDFLKVGHHGSAYSTGKEFLEKAQPDYAAISCALKNRYGHPSSDTVNRILESGCEMRCTKDNGAIILETDGKRRISFYSFL